MVFDVVNNWLGSKNMIEEWVVDIKIFVLNQCLVISVEICARISLQTQN